ncbi:hypothetical protein HMPREF1210_00619 [Paenisporosarcina sp. HGH0030]|uniref:hypothetical protein n=1 Tax=Paenisporosarcina sp. HGH0030 TaxID=1078085 RepID=UPI00034E8FBC|nr:hypothetical protein [Paenisporosarcina sp. HGH0030]EPD53796.1 hypothetical protein HMPREF1210_00619 [Paenisporosarcina sp. HGH0030]
MIDDKKMNQFTLVDVIERKIQFTNTNTIYDKTEFKDINEGELLANYDMLADVKEMKENEFVSKYLNIINKLTVQFENEELTDKREIEKMSGYNNAIVSILKCINPIYEYYLED